MSDYDKKSDVQQISSVLSKARALLSESDSSSVGDTIKQRNTQLQELLNKYQQKFSHDETESKLSHLQEESTHKDEKLHQILDITSEERSSLQDRELSFHEKLADFEQERALLESKRDIVMNEIRRIDDPRIKKTLSFIDEKFDELDAKKRSLQEREDEFQFKEKQLLGKENKLYHSSVKKQQEVQRYEEAILNLQNQQEDLEMAITGLKQKKTDIELLIRERSDLVSDINKQFSDSKLQLRQIQDTSAKEQQLLARTREEIQNERRSLRQERINFDGEKEAFYSKMKSMSEESKKEVDTYRTKVLADVKTQINMADEKLDTLRSREGMLQKLEQELRQREQKISIELDKVAKISSVSKNDKEEYAKKVSQLDKQKSDLKEYEGEVTQLEQTVLDLKQVIESKEKELSHRLSQLESKEAVIEQKSRDLHNKLSHIQSLTKDAGFDAKFKTLFKDSKDSLDAGELMQAQSSYTKACEFYKYLDHNIKAAYAPLLKNLYNRIRTAINN